MPQSFGYYCAEDGNGRFAEKRTFDNLNCTGSHVKGNRIDCPEGDIYCKCGDQLDNCKFAQFNDSCDGINAVATTKYVVNICLDGLGNNVNIARSLSLCIIITYRLLLLYE